MKRNIFFSSAALWASVLTAAQAQTSTMTTSETELASPSPAGTSDTTVTESNRRTTTTTTETAQPALDSIVMSAGALVAMRDGKATRLDQPFMLGNGMRISPGGTVMLKDGSSTSLRDGQMINAAGDISTAPPAAISAANDALDAGTDGPGVSRRDAMEGVSAAAARAVMPAASATPTADLPLTQTGGEVMGGHQISTDQPLANPGTSASPNSNRPLRRGGGATH